MSIVVIGGGAAGFFAALAAKEGAPSAEVILLEKSSQLLSKVRISGGGRCNVTHACFDPRELVKNYPRGSKELLGPFHRYQPLNTIEWFESRGVILKTEDDGRMFPNTDSSSTIIDCLTLQAKKSGVKICTKIGIEALEKRSDGFLLSLSDGSTLICDALLVATGSHPSGFKIAKDLGHTIVDTVPSLFTFNIPSSPLKELAGVVIDPVKIQLKDTELMQTGPLLVTHWGFSGPAALKLSAWGARYLKEKNYHATLTVNWIPNQSQDNFVNTLKSLRNKYPAQILANNCPEKQLTKSFWKKTIDLLGLHEKRLSETSNDDFIDVYRKLSDDHYTVDGKTTNKEEFVTCGGVALNEVNFKSMESKLCSNLFFAGEILNIDAVTGGFNFQNAWTTGWIAGQSMAAISNTHI